MFDREDGVDDINLFARNEPEQDIVHQVRRHEDRELRENCSNKWEMGFKVEIPEF